MSLFAAGEIKVLITTTVIEVGVNVPNATLMIIENADRFGLAQMHQLRGRVGRGKDQSYCVLLTDNDNKETLERLQVLRDSDNGFFLAEKIWSCAVPGNYSVCVSTACLIYILLIYCKI